MSPKAKPNSTKEYFKDFIETRIIGADDTLIKIFNYIQAFSLGLKYPAQSPTGTFLLLGPTGVGKTHTVEVIAEWLHGSPRNILKIDCGEFQMEHEVAKLIGAPPGYLGHRETTPMLNQQKLNAVTSERSNLSVILFDEIEKAAPSMMRILLGILDKGHLRLGDNSAVSFERSLIFLTSNLGAKKLGRSLGFLEENKISAKEEFRRVNLAVERFFSPEFINRISEQFHYRHLTKMQIEKIFDMELRKLAEGLPTPHGRPDIIIEKPLRNKLVSLGFSRDFGARELQRTLKTYLLHGPLTTLAESGTLRTARKIHIGLDSSSEINVWAE